jgi:L-ectoine synthase
MQTIERAAWPAALVGALDMIVRHLRAILGTDRDVHAPTFASRRLLLSRDKLGFSLHDTVIYAGTETPIRYSHHIEAVYCVAGAGEMEVVETGETYQLRPGTLYALDNHEGHLLRARTELRMICVFTPPLTGREVHDSNGAYPLIADEALATERT